jgi:oxalate---CoA ligase
MPPPVIDPAGNPVKPQALCALLRGDAAPSLITPDDETVLTHEELAAHVESLASCLARGGVERGDRIALVFPPGPEIVELLFALAALGAAAAPLNPAYTHDEFAFSI